MRKRVTAIFCLICLLLCACHITDSEPASETEQIVVENVATELAHTEPTPTEPEGPKLILVGDHDFKLYDGIYVLDTSEYGFEVDEVFLDINLADMTFTLKCFDGSVVSGILNIESENLICSYEGGQMLFGFLGMPDDASLNFYPYYGDMISVSPMFCPQVDSSLQAEFFYAEDREDEIVADPEAVPLDSYKHLHSEIFYFEGRIPGKEDPADYDACSLTVRNYPLERKWVFQHYRKSQYGYVEVTAVESPDGSISFTQEGKQWNFHREGDSIVFDGGSPLTVGNWNGVKERAYLEMEVPEGATFNPGEKNYVYDALYILPGETLDEAYAGIQLDTKNQLVKIHCYDGEVLSGPYTYGDEYGDYYLMFSCEIPDYYGMRTANIMLIPNGHSLNVGNQWMLDIGPGDMGSRFYFFPVRGVDYQENVPSETEKN